MHPSPWLCPLVASYWKHKSEKTLGWTCRACMSHHEKKSSIYNTCQSWYMGVGVGTYCIKQSPPPKNKKNKNKKNQSATGLPLWPRVYRQHSNNHPFGQFYKSIVYLRSCLLTWGWQGSHTTRAPLGKWQTRTNWKQLQASDVGRLLPFCHPVLP